MDIDRPIFIMAPHRSGTTLLYSIMSKHPDVGYFNAANRRWGNSPFLSHIVSSLGLKVRPHEVQNIWDRYWTTDDDRMGAQDATPEGIEHCRRLVARMLRLRKATRFVAKYPRLSFRMDWINAVFPDALFVHMARDWRAVVNSTLQRRYYRDGKSGKWYGCRIPGWQGLRGEDPPLVAGRQVRLATQAIEAREEAYAGRFHRLHYADLCKRPVEVMRELCEAVDLRWTPEFEASLPTDLRCANFKWRENLTPEVVEGIRAEDHEFYDAHTEEDE